jgi:hypothetical protein
MKEEDFFQKESRKKSGFSSACKECLNRCKKEQLDKRREKIREYNLKKYYENHESIKEKRRETSKEHRTKKKDDIREYKRKWWIKHAERLREEQNTRKRSEDFRKKRKEYLKTKVQDGELFKMGARKIFQLAVKFKHIIRPEKCEKCLKICKPHGHHEDYNKPLDVLWLCNICHNHVHGKLLDKKP